MRQAQSSDRSQLPGTSGIAANLLGQRGSTSQKRELVILIKPTLIQNDSDWARDLKEAQDRVLGYTADSATQ
jgi:MSHA biogenesis protein MshL